ncbi:hypothetical protein ACNSOO_08555 [Aliarcobacter lanthieri]|uniref:hypothetical protein n=1 Tax=Aliarcobacter lanthieri TaxID=1355374 RepID=UPI00047A8BF8|nr:hypothetical protein [Aliarcobacter lanthieri]QKF59159.1 hypothetical protein ALANTH_1049 [Aliarcobacter lanthieri]
MKRRTKNFIEDTIIVIIVLFIMYLIYFFLFSQNSDVEEINTSTTQTLSTNTIENEKSFLITVYEEIKEKLFEDDKQELNSNELKVEDAEKPVQNSIHMQRSENRLQNTTNQTEDTNNSESQSIINEENINSLDKQREEQRKEQLESKTSHEDIPEKIITEEENHENIKKEEVSNTKPLIEIKTDENSDNDQEHTSSITNIDDFFHNFEKKVLSNIDKNVDKSNFIKGESLSIRITILKDGRYEQLTLISGNSNYFNLIKNSIEQVFPLKIEDNLKINFPRYYRMKIDF